jgi:hypothetical protein
VIGKPEEDTLLGGPKRRWMNNNKMHNWRDRIGRSLLDCFDSGIATSGGLL